MEPSPLRDLADFIGAEMEVPFEWMVEYAADLTIHKAWYTSQDVSSLFRVGILSQNHVAMVKAAVACVRTVLKHVPRGEHRPRAAVEAAAAWARGTATPVQLARARADAEAYTEMFPGIVEPIGLQAAANAAYQTILAVYSDSRYGAYDAYEAVHLAAGVAGKTMHAVRLRRFAVIVRQIIPCPTLAQVMAAPR